MTHARKSQRTTKPAQSSRLPRTSTLARTTSLGAAALAFTLLASCKSQDAPGVSYEQHVNAGGIAPPSARLTNPFRGDTASITAGGRLFTSMNCDGCHGIAADGFAGPSLIDGRWRYGGADAAVFQSIFYGRPNGMPAYGGIATPELTWKVVTWLQSQKPPRSVPTTSW